MARSADARGLAVLAAGCVALALVSGCDTTQESSMRAKVRAERVLTSRKAVRVTHANPEVRAVEATVVAARNATAIAVVLHNAGAKTVNDLPVSVGIRSRGHAVRYLNTGPNHPYFQTHAPAIAPGGEATWVYTTRARVPEGTPVAVVGLPARPAPATASSLPKIGATDPKLAGATALAATVSNASDVPQYGLQVYAYAERHGRVVAAGSRSLPNLHTGRTATVRVGLIGRPQGATLHVEAPPTIFS